MLTDYVILAAMWLFGIAGFFLLIPRNNRRKGILSFMVFQGIIWLCDMPSFKYDLLSAPVRVLPKATDLTITINYLFYPVLFSIYYVNRRVNSSIPYRIIYYLFWVSSITLFDVILERYTNLLEYGRITWSGMWIYIGFIFFVSVLICNWFYKEELIRTKGSEPNDH
ncbi:CBO0543 family protein [Ornithinibacillus scapharcae]|uniref:CBO0543 family protein n=1 Tax=Ornithinibacillus scapharcae TaxID=1147159 RepID=UPI000225B0B6|nr:CBO0543 family protein [Ornithinibacillus scapharcae]